MFGQLLVMVPAYGLVVTKSVSMASVSGLNGDGDVNDMYRLLFEGMDCEE